MMAIEASDNKTFIDDDKVKKRNPAILAILDPLHRSLLTNNLRYEQGKYMSVQIKQQKKTKIKRQRL